MDIGNMKDSYYTILVYYTNYSKDSFLLSSFFSKERER